MNRMKITALAILLICIISSDALGISRVARRLNLMEIYGGVGMPSGEYDGFPGLPFEINSRRADAKADDIYGSAFHFGITYGQLRNRHILVSVGFQFTENAVEDAIPLSLDTMLFIFTPWDGFKIRQYDLTFNLNYFLLDLNEQSWSPYFGIGFQAGIASLSFDDFPTENEFTTSLGFNFGADLRLWQDPGERSMVTLSSINTWNFVTSNDRPAYLQIGGGIRYWFRP